MQFRIPLALLKISKLQALLISKKHLKHNLKRNLQVLVADHRVVKPTVVGYIRGAFSYVRFKLSQQCAFLPYIHAKKCSVDDTISTHGLIIIHP